MTKIADLLRWVARIAGSIALILGLLLWFGMAVSLMRVHIFLGIVTAASLALVALVAIVARARIPMAIVGLLWAAATIYLGFHQDELLIGASHWIIDTAHLALGVGAIGMCEGLAAGIRGNATSVASR